MKFSENVDLCLLTLADTFLFTNNIFSSPNGTSRIFPGAVTPIKKEVITPFWTGVTANWMGSISRHVSTFSEVFTFQ